MVVPNANAETIAAIFRELPQEMFVICIWMNKLIWNVFLSLLLRDPAPTLLEPRGQVRRVLPRIIRYRNRCPNCKSEVKL